MSFFREFMSENLPEQANGARMAEIWSRIIIGVPGCREDLPAPSKTVFFHFPHTPANPENVPPIN